MHIWGCPQLELLRIKDYSILGSILGSPYFGKLPYEECENNGPLSGIRIIASV